MTQTKPPTEPIAIIGTGCRFPGSATTPSKFWDLLTQPRDLVQSVSDRFSPEGWHHLDGKHHGHCNVTQSYLLDGDDHRRFDAQFFGINAVEANTLDPQVRLLLETVYEALECAGLSMEGLRGSDTAIYTGMMGNSYKTAMERDLDSMGTYHVSGVSRAMMANRLSYFFDWHGPSLTIDTACSSSLIAIHQAVQQLRAGHSHVAIAAGSNLLLDPADYVGMSNLEMLSPTSRSRMWDKDADGYARGEGVAAVVLKTLSAAEADGDHIECVIRETATNQDGRTMGITMPSAAAQAQLIRDCYSRAGLDPTDPKQRPQYFEAHGTGTPAGDPVEAEAIRTAFFPNDTSSPKDSHQLIVGGVKTIIGHSESTAGLAGLIKVSLALQHSTIPPNLLFNEIHPKVAPFYRGYLKIPTEVTAWSVPVDGTKTIQVRRASVNSFGFGGSNAHAILESYTPSSPSPSQSHRSKQLPQQSTAPFLPFLFSATSEPTLRSYLSSLSTYLQTNMKSAQNINLRNLSMTLHAHRSRLPYALSISASTIPDLCSKLDEISRTTDQGAIIRPSFRESSPGTPPKILAIFTGQGAQSVHMGAALIQKSPSCRAIISRLEARLASLLPLSDRPSWSLTHELLNPAADVGKAELSQPLCTALQILQVDLMRQAGVQFSAAVGHSSGEIAAAYCAGVISAEDAICIAYYRGLACSASGGQEKGAMLAVGTSFEDARDICNEPEFAERVSVAAVNSAASVTISGDEDAIEEIKVVFQDEGKFVRRLRVDKAYHSRHMVACSGAYLAALEKLDVRVNRNRDVSCRWVSSVGQGSDKTTLMVADTSAARPDMFKARYWVDNMVKPVMFMPAIQATWESHGPFDMAVEIGPHPALKGPTLQTIQDITPSHELPYTGVHVRGQDAVESFADALGHMWKHLGPAAPLNLSNYDQFVQNSGDYKYNIIKGLPPYAWDHEKIYWHESRYAKAQRYRSDPVHELLGHLTPDSTSQDMRWRNILSPREVPWLHGHALQNQPVFPAAGYVVAAAEAAAAMAQARGLSVSLIEIVNIDIGNALTFDTDDTRIEIVTTLAETNHQDDCLEALFRFNGTPTLGGTVLTLLAGARVRVRIGDADDTILPARDMHPSRFVPDMFKIETDDFYTSLAKLDYQYSGPFRALDGLERRFGFATGHIAQEPSKMLIHPAMLDAAFQSVLLAHCAPNSGGIWALHVPKTIRAVQINPSLCRSLSRDWHRIVFECTQPVASAGLSSLEGNVELFVDSTAASSEKCPMMIRVDGLQCVPFSQANPQDDKTMFAQVLWDVAAPNADLVVHDGQPTAEHAQTASLLERVAIFYLRRLDTQIPHDHPARREGSPYRYYFQFASHILSSAEKGTLPFWSPDWVNDTPRHLDEASKPYSHLIDFRLLTAIGENVVDIVTGKTQAIEVGMRDGMLSEYYQHALGFAQHTGFLARLVRQIVHRHPGLNILEVGAGTGSATRKIFSEIGKGQDTKFASYTYTDISSGFFEAARASGPGAIFTSAQVNKMVFRVLDVAKDIRGQGYVEGSYDVVIASAVLHATSNLTDVLRNVRRLLKPGGFLVVLELPDLDSVARVGTIFGSMPGWWLGVEDGRVLSPCVGLARWDSLLRSTGFSGCDTATPVRDSAVMPVFVFVSQAVDDRVEFLRDPLSVRPPGGSLFAGLGHEQQKEHSQNLVLVGGGNSSSLQVSRMVAQLRSLLSQHWDHDNIRVAQSLSDVSSLSINSETTVLSLADVDLDQGKVPTSTFRNLTDGNWEGLKTLLQEAGTMLWVSRGRRLDNPHANMMVGLLRAARHEIPWLDVQSLDIETTAPLLDARELAESLLRFKAAVMWRRRDGNESFLTTIEPELIRQDVPTTNTNDGTQTATVLMVPRVVASREMNDRYNSSRRPIISSLAGQTGDTNYQLAASTEGVVSLQRIPVEKLPGEAVEDTVVIRTAYSHRSAFRVSRNNSPFMHIILGQDSASDKQMVVLTSSQPTLLVTFSPGLAAPVLIAAGDEPAFVTLLAYHFLAASFFDGLLSQHDDLADGKQSVFQVVVYQPRDKTFAAVMAEEAGRHGQVQLVFLTSTSLDCQDCDSNWHRIHPMASDSTIRAVLPANTAAFLDLGHDTQVGISSRLRDHLSRNCYYSTLDTLLSPNPTSSSKPLSEKQVSRISSRLKDCVARTVARLGNCPDLSTYMVHLEGQTATTTAHPMSVIAWSLPSSFQVQPADSQVRFSDSRTYWLAGLSGGLGLLLCEWMIGRGAKNFVISSRRAQGSIKQVWVDKMRSAHGAMVHVVSCDVTEKSALSHLYSHIQATMPRIGGVCQGAMVLQDIAIRDMPLDNLAKVTRPKVEGSLYLDQLFQHQQDLDFFVFFSSVGSISGQPGQGNYAAANLFMTTLAEQRRRRGQVASVMHIGPIFGAGYITQQGLDSSLNSMRSTKTMTQSWFPITEQDFFQQFAEAIMTGQRAVTGERNEPLEITTGLARFASSHEAGPFLSHYTLSDHQNQQINENMSGDKAKAVPLKERLAEARGRSQLTHVIREAVLLKLSVLFQAELDGLEQADPATLCLSEMGMDSLMAVEMRSWFGKLLQVNIPVLKLLSGASVAELIAIAVETIPRSLAPLADEEGSGPEPVKHQPVTNPRIKVDMNPKPVVPSLSPQRDRQINSAVEQTARTETATDRLQQPLKQIVEPMAETLGELKLPSIQPLALGVTTFSSDDDPATPSVSSISSDVSVDGGGARADTPLTPPNPSSDYDRVEYPKHKDVNNGPLTNPLVIEMKLDRILPLSYSQSLFWFSAAFSSDNPANLNLTAAFRITSSDYAPLQIDKLKEAVVATGQQHESLRTCYFVDPADGQPKQGIMTRTALELEHHTIDDNDEAGLQHLVNGIHSGAYILESGRTVRLVLVSHGHSYYFIIGVHHMAMDGASFQPLMGDILHHYTRIVSPSCLDIEETSTTQYPDFVQRQLDDFASGAFDSDLDFWKAELLPNPPPILPILRCSTLTTRPTLQDGSYGNRYVTLRIGPEIKSKIQALCRQSRATPFHFYLAVFRVLLWRYSGSGEFSIGIGDANRSDNMMGAIGDFVNMLPIVFSATEEASLVSTVFEDLLREIRGTAYRALEHSRVPFQLMLNELGVPRSANTTPIFQAFVDYRLVRGEKMPWGHGRELELVSFQPSKVAYDVALDIVDNNSASSTSEDYCSKITFILRDDLYTQADAERLADSFSLLTTAFASSPSITLGKADIFSQLVMEEALDLGRGPVYQSRGGGNTILHQIDRMAQHFPDQTAVISGDGVVASSSYYDVVVRRVDKIVGQLQAAGVSPGSTVAVLQEATPDWVSSILAVMRIGAAYLPLDPGQPWARLASMVGDCQPQVVLVDEHTREHVHRLENMNINIVVLAPPDKNHGKEKHTHRHEILATPDTVSTILYTSGSSGTPKGIVLTHRGIRSWLEPCDMLFDLTRRSDLVTLQQSAQGFDMSLMQIFTALYFGGGVYLLPRKLRGDARAISASIVRHGVTHTYGTPSEVMSWLRHADDGQESLRSSSWRTALVGGEMLSPAVLSEFAALDKRDLRFYHMYGTTEATFCAAVMELDYYRLTGGAGPYPAGVALPNYSVYILDECGRALPPGLRGEVYIGGAGVGRGYLNNPSLTDATFVPDLFASDEDRRVRGWGMMQRTGDLARWSGDDVGALLVEGRISGDTMVKLRGLRVDLREIEVAILRAADELTDAVVSVRRRSPDSPEFLVAYVVVSAGKSSVSTDNLGLLRTQLELQDLPHYMRPAFIVALDKLPMTSSGKLDRKTVSTLPLPEYDEQQHNDDYQWTPVEKKLRRIWEDLLLVSSNKITPKTDFFHVGGTSLTLLTLRDRIQKEFSNDASDHITLVDLFEASTLSDMARRIVVQGNGGGISQSEIDWEEETRLRPSMLEIPVSPGSPPTMSGGKVVILTGATGHLGSALLRSMLTNPAVQEIYCLGVRNASTRSDLSTFRSNKAVTFYEGDLAQPLLGLSQQPATVVSSLFRRADIIIHNGADTSYMKTYHSMRQPNVSSTKDLIEYGLTHGKRMIPIHFVSTAGVGNLLPDAATSVLNQTSMAFAPPTDGSMGYVASKWASERFLERLVERYPAWPVHIHRPSLISRGEVLLGDSGEKMPMFDGVHNIFGYAKRLKAVPSAEGVARGVMNVVRLDDVVQGILDAAGLRPHRLNGDGDATMLTRGSGDRGKSRGVHFINHVGKLNLPLDNMRKWAAVKGAEDGSVEVAAELDSPEDFDEIPLEEWVRRACELGMHPALAAVLLGFARHGEVGFPAVAANDEHPVGGGGGESDVRINHSKTEAGTENGHSVVPNEKFLAEYGAVSELKEIWRNDRMGVVYLVGKVLVLVLVVGVLELVALRWHLQQ